MRKSWFHITFPFQALACQWWLSSSVFTTFKSSAPGETHKEKVATSRTALILKYPHRIYDTSEKPRCYLTYGINDLIQRGNHFSMAGNYAIDLVRTTKLRAPPCELYSVLKSHLHSSLSLPWCPSSHQVFTDSTSMSWRQSMIDYTMSKVKRSSVTTRQTDLGSSCPMKYIRSRSAYLLYHCLLL